MDKYGHGLPPAEIDYTLPHDAVPGAPSITHHKVAVKTSTDADIRCQGQVAIRNELGEFKTCGKLLAKLASRPWMIECPRCKTVNRSPE
jgi:hypothetical protein